MLSLIGRWALVSMTASLFLASLLWMKYRVGIRSNLNSKSISRANIDLINAFTGRTRKLTGRRLSISYIFITSPSTRRMKRWVLFFAGLALISAWLAYKSLNEVKILAGRGARML